MITRYTDDMDEKHFGMQQALGAATQIVQYLEQLQTGTYEKGQVLDLARRLLDFDAPQRPRSLGEALMPSAAPTSAESP